MGNRSVILSNNSLKLKEFIIYTVLTKPYPSFFADHFFDDAPGPRTFEDSSLQLNRPELSTPDLGYQSLASQNFLDKALCGPSNWLQPLELLHNPNLEFDAETLSIFCNHNGEMGPTGYPYFGTLTTNNITVAAVSSDQTLEKTLENFPSARPSVEFEGNTSLPINSIASELFPLNTRSATSKQPQENLIKRQKRKIEEYACSDCDKTFAKERDLSTHIFSHGKQRSHSCTVCNVKCTRRDNLKVHMERMHPVEWKASDPGKKTIYKRKKRRGKEKDVQGQGNSSESCNIVIEETSNDGNEEDSNISHPLHQQLHQPIPEVPLAGDTQDSSSPTELRNQLQRLLEENRRLKRDKKRQKREYTAKIKKLEKLLKDTIQMVVGGGRELESSSSSSETDSSDDSAESERPPKNKRRKKS